MAEKSPIIENEILFPNTGSLLHREGFYWKKRYKGSIFFAEENLQDFIESIRWWCPLGKTINTIYQSCIARLYHAMGHGILDFVSVLIYKTQSMKI